MKRLRIIILAAILLLIWQGGVSAQTYVGTMVLNKGVVKLRRAKIDTLYRTVGQQIPVRALDQIQTGKNSSVTINLKARDDKLELYSQSFFKIDRITKESSQVSMSIGKARFKIKKPTQPLKARRFRKKRFRVRTANAIVGVKGTEFVMAAGTDVTSVLTIEGVVDVASIAAPEIEVEVAENQASQIKQASTPTAPVTVPPSVKENILNTDSPNVFNNVSFGATVSPADVKQEQKKKSQQSGEKPNSQQKQESRKSDSQSGPGNASGGKGGATAAAGTAASGAAALLTSDDNDEEKGSTGNGTGTESDDNNGAAVSGQASETDSNAIFTGETGDDNTFGDDTGTAGLGGSDVINLETIETADLDNLEIEEPDINPDDVLDVDSLIEGIEDSTDELQDEIEQIQEEVLENQLQEIQIKITYPQQ